MPRPADVRRPAEASGGLDHPRRGLRGEAGRSPRGRGRPPRAADAGVSRACASNENPYCPSPTVARALVDLAAQVGHYPDAQCTALRAAIGERTGVAADCIVVGNGSEDILQMLCQAFLSPGARVLTQRPAFGLHEIYPRMMGAQVELLELTPALGFDTDAWCAALARGPHMAMLANPSNPVGCMFDAGEFTRLLAARNDFLCFRFIRRFSYRHVHMVRHATHFHI